MCGFGAELFGAMLATEKISLPREFDSPRRLTFVDRHAANWIDRVQVVSVCVLLIHLLLSNEELRDQIVDGTRRKNKRPSCPGG